MQSQLFPGKVMEADVLKACMHLLTLKGVFHFRNNSGAYSDAKSGRYIRFGKKGSSDILAVYPQTGQFWAIECKRPKGLLSDDQIIFLKDIRRAGGISTIAESIDDILRFLDDRCARNADRYEKLLS